MASSFRLYYLEQPPGLLVEEPVGHGVLLVQGLEDLLDRLLLLNEFQRRLWADSANLVAVVTAQQDAEVDELVHGHLQTLQDLCKTRDNDMRKTIINLRFETLLSDKGIKSKSVEFFFFIYCMWLYMTII